MNINPIQIHIDLNQGLDVPKILDNSPDPVVVASQPTGGPPPLVHIEDEAPFFRLNLAEGHDPIIRLAIHEEYNLALEAAAALSDNLDEEFELGEDNNAVSTNALTVSACNHYHSFSSLESFAPP